MRGCPDVFFFFKSKLNTGVHSYLKTKKLISDERTEFLNARNAKIRKKFCSMDVIFSLKGICNNKKKICLYPETLPRKMWKFGGKLVENLEIYLNK